MGQNGKNTRRHKSFVPAAEKTGNDKEIGKTKKRQFKVGPYRANSAVDSFNEKTTVKNNRLIRSQSVETAAIYKHGKLSGGLGLPDLTVSPLRRNWATPLQQKDRGEEMATSSTQLKVQQSHSSGNIPKENSGNPKKRRPFSFSRGFDYANDSNDEQGGGDNDNDKAFEYQHHHETRSPRVHFADTLCINEKSTESNNSSGSSAPDLSSEPTNHRTEEDRGRNSSPDVIELPNAENSVDVREKGKKLMDPNFKPKRSYSISDLDHERILANTDDIIMNAARFIADISSASAKNFPVKLNFSYSPNKPSEQETLGIESFEGLSNIQCPSGGGEQLDTSNFSHMSVESVDGLSNMQCPSIIMMDSARSTINSIRGHNFNRSQEGILQHSSSRPASAASFLRSVSNDDIHGHISYTLKMIEQEEQNLRMKASSIPDKLETVENLGSGTWGTNAYSYPMSLPSTSVSEYGTRPSSRASTSNTAQQLGHHQIESQPPSEVLSTKLPHFSPHLSEINSFQSCNNIPESCGSCMGTSLVSSQQHSAGQNVTTSKLDKSSQDISRETCNEKARKIFSFLDQVEKADRQTLLGLSSNHNGGNVIESENCNTNKSRTVNSVAEPGSNFNFLQTIDSLIRRGSVELAKEHIIIERKFEESKQRIQVLEETLIHQRELNMRNMRNSDKDLKKRLRLQKEEFDVAFARNEALINEMVAEKRILQERCDKLMKNFDETETKYREQIKNLQQKHLDEIKRLRKSQITAETMKKQQWVGNKTQEIREMTVKWLEPEVQRIIQRHQKEMSEMRAWQADELRETEERCQRKLHMQLQDMREKVSQEAEAIICKEKEQLTCRFESGLKQREEEFELIRRRLLSELQEERERAASDEIKFKGTMQETVRKTQIKGEVELDNFKQECEAKIANIERRHTNEIKSMKDVHEAETKTLANKLSKQFESEMKEKETELLSDMKLQLENELRDKEKRLKEEFQKVRKEEEVASDTRFKRMQEKFTADLQEMDQTEKDLKSKLNQAKSQLLLVEEQVYSLRTSLSMKEKQNDELQDANMKMLEERAHLTSVIRREFSSQIETLENEVRGMRSNLVEIQAKHKLELEQRLLENDMLCHEKDAEIDRIGLRVQQTIARKDETIHGLQKQLEKLNFQVQHLEGLLEEQRKSLVDSMTKSTPTGGKRK